MTSATRSELDTLRHVMRNNLHKNGVSNHDDFLEAYDRIAEVIVGGSFEDRRVWAYVMKGLSKYMEKTA